VVIFSRGISEIVLIVQDVEGSARFYRDVVGFVPRTEPDEGWAWFWAGPPGRLQSVGLREGTLLFEGMSPRREGERWGPVHYAFEMPRERIVEALDRVRGSGVEVYGPVHFHWMKADSYYFYDADDNQLKFWSPDPAVEERTEDRSRIDAVIPRSLREAR
jgi:catechol 2,3-dioxygenase-like lactoylglutathione lyase family enzyme